MTTESARIRKIYAEHTSMESLEEKALQFFIDKGYISRSQLENIKYKSKSKKAVTGGDETIQDVFYLLKEELSWSQEQFQRVYNSAMENSFVSEDSKTQSFDTESKNYMPNSIHSTSKMIGGKISSLPTICDDSSPSRAETYTSQEPSADVKKLFEGNENEILGRYQIRKTIGQGGMGKVYLAYDPMLEREVALKVLLPTSGVDISNQIERFKREAKAMAKLSHPNIIPVFDVGDAGEKSFFTMSYIRGKSFKDILDSKILSLAKRIKIFKKVLLAVMYAHNLGIIHRDLKPANILIDEREEPFVMDFGLAKLIHGEKEGAENISLTREGVILGSPHYMSPEQAGGKTDEVDHRSDIYSLGIILYEIVTGTVPFVANRTIDVIIQILTTDPTPPKAFCPDIPRDLENICLKAIKKEKDIRYQRIEEMISDLDFFLQGKTKDIPAPPRIKEPVRKMPAISTSDLKPKTSIFPAPTPIPAPMPNITAPPPDNLPPSNTGIIQENPYDRTSIKVPSKETPKPGLILQKLADPIKPTNKRTKTASFYATKKIPKKTFLIHKIFYCFFFLFFVSGIAFLIPYAIPHVEAYIENIFYPLPGFTFLERNFYLCGGKSHKIKEYVHNKTGIIFVLIPGGSFWMGSNEHSNDEKPVHGVEVKSFLLGKYEVTQETWEKIMGKNPSFFKGAKYPVDSVSWFDCVDFCRRTDLFLPGEAQWEYACRAGTNSKYYWGDKMEEQYAWYGTKFNGSTFPVGLKRPNAFGLYDMIGNVREWCYDTWHPNYENAPTNGSAWETAGNERVYRGGSFDDSDWECRSYSRYRMLRENRSKSLGFRVMHPLPVVD